MIRKIMLVLLLMGIGVLGYGYQTTDTVTLTLTPNFTLSVNISSTTASLGTPDISSTMTIMIGQIMNDGNVSAYWDKQLDPSPGWSLATTASPGTNECVLLLMTTGYQSSIRVRNASGTKSYGVDGQVVNSVLDVPDVGGNWDAAATMDDLQALNGDDTVDTGGAYARGTTRDLYASLLMPTNVIGSQAASARTMTLSIRAVSN